MIAFNKFNSWAAAIAGGVNLQSDTLKVMLSNTTPLATNAVKTDITEIAAGNGYTAGGVAVPSDTYSQTGGTATLAGNQVVFTGTGAVGPFRYAVLYDSTTNDLIGWWDYGSSVSFVNSGDSLTVPFNGSSTAGTIFTPRIRITLMGGNDERLKRVADVAGREALEAFADLVDNYSCPGWSDPLTALWLDLTKLLDGKGAGDGDSAK